MRALSQALVLGVAIFFGNNALAGDGTQSLNWANRHQTLLYSSCGCGDSCWTASLYKYSQIKHGKPVGAPIASLRCDCDKLWAKTPGQQTETEYEANCDRFTTNEKFSLIPNEVSKLTTHTKPQE